ncbi:MAG: uroporphyrinogen decarboxylase family protein [Desulfobacteraceae bacterium]|jgi:uroporphyrinogen decarboxylase|nr:uroporphyrinogen decarboxylase family protein [Desulfobacteraceae bacterium]
MAAIGHRPAASVVRGELTVDPAFARDYLSWRWHGRARETLSHADHVIACCHALKLDLVGIPCGASEDGPSVPDGTKTDLAPFTTAGLCVFALLDGAFQKTAASRQLMTLLADIARCPDEVAAALRRASRQVTAAMAAAVAAGARGIIVADDIAYRQGTYMAPAFVARHLLPVWRDQVAAAADLGVPAFFHSDGNLNRVLPQIVAAGFDGLQCIEPTAGMVISEIRERYGKALCLMGNIDPALLYPCSDLAGVKQDTGDLQRAATDLIRLAAEKSGLIFGTCSGLHAGMSPERVDFMYRLACQPDVHDHAKTR